MSFPLRNTVSGIASRSRTDFDGSPRFNMLLLSPRCLRYAKVGYKHTSQFNERIDTRIVISTLFDTHRTDARG